MLHMPLVTPEEAERIGREVRVDFRAAVAKTDRLARELDEINRVQAKRSPSPVGQPAVRPAKLK